MLDRNPVRIDTPSVLTPLLLSSFRMLQAGGVKKESSIMPNQAIDEGRVVLRRLVMKSTIVSSNSPQSPKKKPQTRERRLGQWPLALLGASSPKTSRRSKFWRSLGTIHKSVWTLQTNSRDSRFGRDPSAVLREDLVREEWEKEATFS